jgi:hypothetical protein
LYDQEIAVSIKYIRPEQNSNRLTYWKYNWKR